MMKTLLALKKIFGLFVAGVLLLATLGLTSTVAAQYSCGATYTVQRGDYLTKIARTCGVSYNDLLTANPTITNRGLIYTGLVLNIPVRIRFATGGTAAIVQGHLGANSKQYTLLNAAANQTLEVTLGASPNLTLAIYGADGSTTKKADNNSFRGALPRTQDYLLVVSDGSSAADFSLSVAIPLRIRFAAGGTSTTLTGTVPSTLSQLFILNAAEGQILNVSASPQDKLQLIIYGVDGSVLRSGMGQGASFTGVLPSTQDYFLVLRSANQVQAFTLNVSIPAGSPTPVKGTGSYTVQKSDTLISIAHRFQTTVDVLLRANPEIINRNVITAGQIIYLPGATLTLSNSQVVFIARSGDTMGMIARQFNTALKTLISANPQISNPNLIYPGQRVNIP
jgi:LysM repeat protein